MTQISSEQKKELRDEMYNCVEGIKSQINDSYGGKTLDYESLSTKIQYFQDLKKEFIKNDMDVGIYNDEILELSSERKLKFMPIGVVKDKENIEIEENNERVNKNLESLFNLHKICEEQSGGI
jgi:hypothetical protein